MKAIKIKIKFTEIFNCPELSVYHWVCTLGFRSFYFREYGECKQDFINLANKLGITSYEFEE